MIVIILCLTVISVSNGTDDENEIIDELRGGVTNYIVNNCIKRIDEKILRLFIMQVSGVINVVLDIPRLA